MQSKLYVRSQIFEHLHCTHLCVSCMPTAARRPAWRPRRSQRPLKPFSLHQLDRRAQAAPCLACQSPSSPRLAVQRASSCSPCGRAQTAACTPSRLRVSKAFQRRRCSSPSTVHPLCTLWLQDAAIVRISVRLPSRCPTAATQRMMVMSHRPAPSRPIHRLPPRLGHGAEGPSIGRLQRAGGRHRVKSAGSPMSGQLTGGHL